VALRRRELERRERRFLIQLTGGTNGNRPDANLYRGAEATPGEPTGLVAFEYIEKPDERAWFRNLPTTFELPRDTIDKLRAVGRRLLAEDPGFKQLMEALNGQLGDR